MLEKCKALYARYGDILRYLIIGGLTTLLDYAVFALMFNALGVHYQIASVFSWMAAVAFAFCGNKWVVFRAHARDLRTLLRESVSFVTARLATLGVNALFLYVSVDMLGMHANLAKLLANVLVIILNYVLSRLFVFKRG